MQHLGVKRAAVDYMKNECCRGLQGPMEEYRGRRDGGDCWLGEWDRRQEMIAPARETVCEYQVNR